MKSTSNRRTLSARRNKYGVRTDDAGKLARTYDGRTYASLLEARFARQLDVMRAARRPSDRVVSWRPQVRFALVVSGVKVCTYVVDFEVAYADGRTELIETKGYWTPDAKLKLALFRALYPGRALRIVEVV